MSENEKNTQTDTPENPPEEHKNKPEDKKESMGREVMDFLKDLVIAFVVVFLLFKVLMRPIEVIGSSMYPTLQDKSYGVSNVIGTKLGHIERFDIVIIHIEEKNEYIVKRVIGMPGETVSYTDGQLYINGEATDEPFLDEDYVSTYADGTFMSDVEPITLDDDEYYCLGDNRPHSSDSRYYGPFKEDQIVAKGVFILFPFSRAGLHTW